MKHAIIVHGFKGKPDTNWKPWLKRELEGEGFVVNVPEMPNTDYPEVLAWVSKLASTVGNVNDEIYLIGHSLGCITILKYLEKLDARVRIKACVFVAGFGEKFEGYNGGHDSFFEESVDWEKVKSHCDEFYVIHSKDDPNVPFSQRLLFGTNLDANTTEFDGMGHFGSADGVFEIPIVKEIILGL